MLCIWGNYWQLLVHRSNPLVQSVADSENGWSSLECLEDFLTLVNSAVIIIFFANVGWLLWHQNTTKMHLGVVWSRRMLGMPRLVTGQRQLSLVLPLILCVCILGLCVRVCVMTITFHPHRPTVITYHWKHSTRPSSTVQWPHPATWASSTHSVPSTLRLEWSNTLESSWW